MHGQMRGAAVNVYAGSNCTCQQLPARPGQGIARYSIRATADSRIIGNIRWHPRQQRYVFVPAPDTCWSSRDLAGVGRLAGLRTRLSRCTAVAHHAALQRPCSDVS